MSEFYFEANPKRKECPLSITKMNKYYLLPFLVPIVCFSTKFCSEPMKEGPEPEKSNPINRDVEHTFVFIYTLINSTSHILGGLLYIISFMQSKPEIAIKVESENKSFKMMQAGHYNNNELEKNRTESSVILYRKGDKYWKLKLFGILFGMGFVLTIYNVIKGYALNNKQLEKRLYFLFFFTLFNVYLLKKEIFIHQKVSLAIAGLGMAILFSIYFIYLDYKIYKPIYDILLFFGSFLYCLYLFFVKYLTHNHGMSPFLVLLFIGIISTISTIIGYIILSVINKGNLFYILNIFHCSKENYVCFGNYWDKILIYLIINSVLQVLIYLVIYYFSPEVFAISDIISPMFSFIQKCITDKNAGKPNTPIQITFNSFGYIIVLFGAFIYNEIIVLNFCGLNKNTWKAIDYRADEDLSGQNFRDSKLIGDYLMDESSEGSKDSLEKKPKTENIDLKIIND